ncbi:ABC transporter substrate-binding protein [Chloroflexota bacterium]
MSVKIQWSVICVLVLTTLTCLVTACTPERLEETELPPGEISFPLEIIDQTGKTIRIKKEPEKIISLAPNITEIVYALEGEEQLIAVTEFCDYPEAALDKPKIGGFYDVNIEKVVALKPDLVLAANFHEDKITPELERLGITALTIDPRTIDDILKAINLVGMVMGRKEAATSVTAEMKNRIEAVTRKTEGLSTEQNMKVLYILWHDPLMTVSSTTRIHEMINKAGGINIAANLEGDYPTISLEAVLLANPQVIISSSGHGSDENISFQFALTEQRLAKTEARLEDRVYGINADLTSRAGPRIVRGLEELAKLIHPELFKDEH